MYQYLDDKEFVHNMRKLAGEIMQSLCHFLKEDYGIGANFYLVGSGAKNLILQNANQSVDLDYNLEIVKCEDFEDCRYLKECARKSFNKALRAYHLCDCEDSTSSLTSKLIHFTSGNRTGFSLDVCVTCRDEESNYYRLIHEKAILSVFDQYYWNLARNSEKLKEKAAYIKKRGKWKSVRQEYEEIKNNYLTRNDFNHPSFVCYVEAVNNVYNAIKHR